MELDPEQTRHARRVLRLVAGDTVRLLDGRGRVALAELVSDDPRSVSCVIQSIQEVPRPSPLIELATAIPKGPRGDAMVNDLAQLGVDRLIPLRTERSVVDPRPAKLQRFNKAAIEAAKQSGRAWFMAVEPTCGFAEALVGGTGLKLVADPYAEPIADLPGRLDAVDTVRVLIGPEGGLTDEELSTARGAGFIPWCYNPNTLRIETAAAAAVAIVRANTL